MMARSDVSEGCIWCGGNGQLETYTEAGEVDESTQCVCVLNYELAAALKAVGDGERLRSMCDFWKRTAEQKGEMFHAVWVEREAERKRADDAVARAAAADADRDAALDALAALQRGES